MINKMVMPKTGQTMETGTIVDWKIKVGDVVKKGDIIMEIETDKATLEIESFHNGQVKAILAEVGDEVPIEEVIALIGDQDDVVDDQLIASVKGQTGSSPISASAPAAPEASPASTDTPSTPSTKKGPRISPRAKKIAREKGIDISTITGTGPGGRITEKDVLVTMQTQSTGDFIPANRIKKITAERMLESKRQIPCFYLNVKVDASALAGKRQKAKAAGQKVSYNDYIIEAVGKALVAYPEMTGQWTGDGIRLAQSKNAGLAISTDEGLVAPTIYDIDKKTAQQISDDTQQLIEKAKAGKLEPTDLEGACITVSNLGMLGIDEFIPIVIPGQASILGVGRISADNKMSMTLSVDHRVADGAYAARFLNCIAENLQ